VPDDELRFLLVHSGERILPELGPELAAYARERLEARGIEFALGTRLAGATADAVTLGDGRTVPTRTLVWTAGNQPAGVLGTLGCERSGTGAVVVDATLRVPGYEDVWAIGDCARIPDPDTDGGFYPPTAQHALREGKTVAGNIAAVLAGREPKPFRFRTIGLLVGLGQRTAAAEIRGRRFSGLAAWLMWRGIYWSKLPGLEKKLRVGFDWAIDLAFARDIVLTSTPARRRAAEEPPDAGRDDRA
jgi:NADH dehydrogenase